MRQVHFWADELVLNIIAAVFDLERRVVEVSKELVVLLLTERIIFVAVALAAFERTSQPDRCCCVDSIQHLIDPILFGVNTRLHITSGESMKACGNALIDRRVG